MGKPLLKSGIRFSWLHINPEPHEIPSTGPGSWGGKGDADDRLGKGGGDKADTEEQTHMAHMQMQEYIIPMVATFSPKYRDLWQKCFNLKTWVH